MIKEQDLLDAIAECQGERNPNANTCIKLAAYYTILDHLKDVAETPQHSFAGSPTINMNTDSEFLRLASGLYVEDVLSLMDELMDTIQAIAPKLYNLTLERLRNL